MVEVSTSIDIGRSADEEFAVVANGPRRQRRRALREGA